MQRNRRPAHEIAEVVRRLDAGESARDVSRSTGIPVATIRNWKRGRIPANALRVLTNAAPCLRCGSSEHEASEFEDSAYAYLLGVYLGDGCLSKAARACALRVVLDEAYPGIIDEVCATIGAVRGRRPHIASDRTGKRCLILTSYWSRWTCLFPQHGPGRKHARKIELRDWQRLSVEASPGSFLRGLIHTDGWRGLNRVNVKGHDYAYPRYQFSNRSDDIRGLFTWACDLLEIEWRPWGRWHVSVARRDSVARLDAFVGPKT